jgi:hypothetical protein
MCPGERKMRVEIKERFYKENERVRERERERERVSCVVLPRVKNE